jgi:hypothetical protein
MAAASVTKKLKTEVRSALRAGFGERGWRAKRGDATTQLAPESVVPSPLELSWSSTIDSYTFGGAVLTGDASLRSPAVTKVLLDVDAGSLPETFENFPGEEYAALMLTLDWVSAGGLVDPAKRSYHKWVVADESELGPVVEAFFAVVDGPLLQWTSERLTPEALLDRHRETAPDDQRRRNPVLVRTLSTLALLEGSAETARWVIRAYADPTDGDTERLALFERELAHRFPEYGPLQLALPS